VDSGIETERRYRGAQKKGGVMTAIDIRSQTVEAIYAAYVAKRDEPSCANARCATR